MIRPILLTATLTGAFCSAFAVFIDHYTDMLAQNQIILISFASGFFGSIFARLVLSRFKMRG
ncbi:MAG: hypothetical protein AAF762_02595, partial [Pseudomonadota bacterium]